jgi:3-methyladenine DNA glycosylase/8-oxoguanine DNA glycosylase
VSPDHSANLRPQGPLHLGLTLAPLRRGPHDPTCRVEGGAVWWATRTPAGPATLRFAQTAGGEVSVDAWGPGAEPALERAPWICGLRDDPTAFRAGGVVGELHRRTPGLRLCATGAVFQQLAPTVLEQRVTGLEAYRSWGKLVRGTSGRAPGPLELWLPPDPACLAALPYMRFHDHEIEAGRANTIRRAAGRAAGLERFAERAPADAERALRSLPGIGAWTSAIVVGVTHGDPDAVPVGDYGLPGLVGAVLANEPGAGDERMLELLEPFAGQRWRAMRLISIAGGYQARRAPRARIRSLRGR